ncbi:hypothetical protein [Nesterenkonia ebinurensis]|uniref:hypothetical protein n=1 Tax=Nesterenkonia ebinurensis TaxID=2608252 RepID=UPI00123CD371|nr:hypothetical protein [Nesterenkonia ebinurensis]
MLVLRVTGGGVRGLMYGVLELADIAKHAADPVQALRGVAPGVFEPATAVRGVLRTLVSDVQDMSWFLDKRFWSEYLTALATHRINRFHLALGMQYNYSHDPDAQDNYLAFAYPFLVDVEGYDVSADGVDAEERARNLAMLRWISSQAALRGIHFQLGLWNHAYDFMDSPRQRYRIQGLDKSNHAQYCRAGLAQLLRECPDISGVTVRVHYEGGVHEPTHEFWSEVFQGAGDSGRAVEIDMHSKGVDSRILDSARSAGGPFMISGKYWAEHQGLPYHQAAVRDMEAALPPREGLSGVTRAVRRFTRYGMGDFLHQDRDYGFLFRIWPGTQRVLHWGDPDQVAGMARAAAQVGAQGVELCEPLTFLGRKTTGSRGGRRIYADRQLAISGDPWQKYAYTYRLWGRLLYNPEADSAQWGRYLDDVYGAAGQDVEEAVAATSRILPLVTTFHGPSASNNFYWPEMFMNMPLANQGKTEMYAFDTPEPHTVGAVSAFDPQLFASVNEYVQELIDGYPSGRYTPDQVADWLEELSATAERHLAAAASRTAETSVEYQRTVIDAVVLAQLGRFFAHRTRATINYEIYVRLGDSGALRVAVEHYRTAREAFAEVASLTKGVYVSDLAFGDRASERGHWSDRLVHIDQDLADLEAEFEAAPAPTGTADALLSPSGTVRSRPVVDYQVPERFTAGEPLSIRVQVHSRLDAQVRAHFRHLNQGESWESTLLRPDADGTYRGQVPDEYTDSRFPVQVYFIVSDDSAGAWIVPGLEVSLSAMPYLVIHPEAGGAQIGSEVG